MRLISHIVCMQYSVICQKKKSKSGPDETRSKRPKLEVEVLEVEKEVALLKAKNLRKEHEVQQLKYTYI